MPGPSLILTTTTRRLAGALVATGVALAVAASGGAVAHAADKPDPARKAPAAPAAQPADAAPASATATATIRMQAANQVVVAVTFGESATSTATITVRDPKRGNAELTWNVAPNARFSGYYKRLADIRPGFVVHLAGPRTGNEAPTADHIIAPGRNKKVLVQNVTVTAVSGARMTITTRDRSGASVTWRVGKAKVTGAAKRLGDLSVGDVVDVRGEVVEGSRSAVATTVRVGKDVKPAKARGKK